MAEFPHYQTAWWLYIALGSLLIIAMTLLLKRTNFWFKVLLLTIAAACTFTPITLSEESSTLAPSLIVSIFELEKSLAEGEGASGVWRGLLPVIHVWIGLFVLAIIGRIIYKSRRRSSE